MQWPSQNKFAILHSQNKFVRWCNGSTSDSGSACEGSNPSKATKDAYDFFASVSFFAPMIAVMLPNVFWLINNVDDKHMHYSKCLSSALLLMMCFTQL